MVTRWRAVMAGIREASSATGSDYHVVKIVMRNMNIRLVVAGHTVQDGMATPGMIHVTEPGAPVRCLFRGPYDVLHLRVPNALIAECADDMSGRPPAALNPTAGPVKDPMILCLGRALVAADQMGGSFGTLFADCVSVGIVARLLSPPRSKEPAKVHELSRWRLKRAIEYIDARLAEPIRLADVAAATGLTRMHFAAQFRAATGQSPHEFLLQRRIERAQEMLVNSGVALVDVALSVGFQSQSHFTSVFKRFAGQPPQAWRRMQESQMHPVTLAG
jgi:AraC-like DNA-binding protein